MRLTLLRTTLIWAVVWPMVTVMLVILARVADDLSLGAQTLILTAILVPLISLVLAPAMQRLATRILKEKT
ncbi:MAG: hypothetical protein JJ901_03260 [Erythrobacter sp.]|uniref:hypothetical protein n=1 Tax=Erythrobacter sp. TaxID=1042 RepID=UPI001B1F253E|nr:hypothetical protein [Erythrobacter sp.]MBO6767307.1 hypothetical protein [Erythrobacter sp.]